MGKKGSVPFKSSAGQREGCRRCAALVLLSLAQTVLTHLLLNARLSPHRCHLAVANKKSRIAQTGSFGFQQQAHHEHAPSMVEKQAAQTARRVCPASCRQRWCCHRQCNSRYRHVTVRLRAAQNLCHLDTRFGCKFCCAVCRKLALHLANVPEFTGAACEPLLNVTA